ncbi:MULTISPECIES: hypothetical protein [Paenibacillus]|uniref:hypothetical protein n=1 Tax=Paenibacillus TaxID=44249 RepID=UPI00096F8DE0|nr:hypothetical protein [Paenibacillus odorifer]OME11119.1 hypothetical protein BSK60_22160 [Paenibacillus odorifer]
MFTQTDTYNIVLAKKLELDWEEQDNLQQAYDTYISLSEMKQKQFDNLIDQALKQCKTDFDCFPESYPDAESMEQRDEIISDIIAKLELIFDEYLE